MPCDELKGEAKDLFSRLCSVSVLKRYTA